MRPTCRSPPATLLAAVQMPFKLHRPPHRQRGGAPPGRAHVRRAARHRHGREEPARGRPHGARSACAGGAGQARAAAAGVEGVPFKPRERVVTRIEQQRGAAAATERRPQPTSCPACQPRRCQLAGTEDACGRRSAVQRPARPAPCRGSERSAARQPIAPPAAGLTERLERVAAPPPRAQVPPAEPAPAEPRFHLTLDRTSSTAPRSGPRRPSASIRTASRPCATC